MLYKKIHRQFVREFRVGRRFRRRYNAEIIYEVTGKPNINYSEGCICVKCEGSINGRWDLVVINDIYFGEHIGERIDKDDITWLNYVV